MKGEQERRCQESSTARLEENGSVRSLREESESISAMRREWQRRRPSSRNWDGGTGSRKGPRRATKVYGPRGWGRDKEQRLRPAVGRTEEWPGGRAAREDGV